MLNYVQPGDTIDLTAPEGGVLSGEPHIFGAIFGVATVTADEGERVAVKVEGVFDLPKATGSGLTEGAKAYWSTANESVTGTATGNTLIGHVIEAAESAAIKARVRLSQ